MKKIVLSLIFLLSLTSFSQSINDYQYVIVPKKFDFFKTEDKYGLNTSVKLLLQKYGFKAYFNDEDFAHGNVGNRCDFLTADLVNESGLMVTKLRVLLKDCKGNVVYQTEVGSSREKLYSSAYNLALRDAAKSFETLNYHYNGSQPSLKNLGKIEETAEVKLASEVKIASETAIPATEPTQVLVSGPLYAQPIANGFQLVNTLPKVVYKIYNTSVKNYYIAIKGEQNGVFFAKDNGWFFEYYQNDKLVSESVEVKF
ncbi:hypothetical protein WMW71_08435 [Flavobacterium buctense]|uniref:Uncharacterized protein n=1 Tax=Flavobacterium buctense TaxID=1648146 RepID=A0ABU9E135_9FLAO|nr:hypothetical protein [Flavobacterium buctense]